MRDDRARKNLDRHPNGILAAHVASGTRPRLPMYERIGPEPRAAGVREGPKTGQSPGRAAKTRLASRYQPTDFLGCRHRLFMASRASW